MPIESVFEEDLLVPIAQVGDVLVMFSSLDGTIYRTIGNNEGAGRYEKVPFTAQGSLFCIPGHPFVYDFIHSEATLSVTEYPLGTSGFGEPQQWVYSSPSSATHKVVALIPAATGSAARIVFEPIDPEDSYWLLGADSGESMPLRHVSIRPRCLLTDGTIITESLDGRWQVIYSDGTILHEGDGKIVSTTSDFVIIKHATKVDPYFFAMVRTTGVTPIFGPDGWSLISMAASDREIIAYAIHPFLGQRLLRATPSSMAFDCWKSECGTAQIFALGAHLGPVIRTTGIGRGSEWLTESGRIPGIAAPRDDLVVKYLVSSDVPCVKVGRATAGVERLFVALHGGPDSHELDDLRYGGTYRDIVDAGWDILIVNYPGSLGFGSKFQKQAWRAWEGAVRTTAQAIQKSVSETNYAETVVFGVSFGAWIALQLEAGTPADRVVVMAPILDLSRHLQLHSKNDQSFRSWAEERFGPLHQVATAAERRLLDSRIPVTVIAPEDDEVVLPDSTGDFIHRAQQLGAKWTLLKVLGNHYPQTMEDAIARWEVLRRVIG